MGGKKWQHKDVREAFVPRKKPKTDIGHKYLAQKSTPTLHRDGRWFSHGLSEYKLWWEFLVRAEQSPDIQVDWSKYEGWGKPKDFQCINVWSSKSRDDGWWKFWKTYGIELFAENDDELVKVHKSGNKLTVGEDKFCLEIPVGTKPEQLMKIIKRQVDENTNATNISHISTAQFPIVKMGKGGALRFAQIKKDAFRRWLKVWDMKQAGESVDEIDTTHGKGGKWLENGKENPGNDAYSTTYRHLWKAKKVVTNVAAGAFPGDIT